MGVGVYVNKFDGSGSTFMVSGPLPTEGEYDALVAAGDELPSFQVWVADVYEEFFETVMDGVKYALSELGIEISGGSGGAPFSPSFYSASLDSLVGAGIKYHEDDIIVATAGGYQFAKWMADPNGYMAEILQETGRAVDGFHESFVSLIENVDEYIRLSLIESGHDCRFATSGYTTQAYSKPDDIEAAKIVLRDAIVAMRSKLLAPAEEVIANATAEERAKLIGDIVETGHSHDLMVPVFSRADGFATLYNTSRDRLDVSAAISSDLPQALFDLPSEGGFSIVPPEPEFAQIYEALRRKAYSRGAILISLDEFEAATGDDLEIQVEGPAGWEVINWSSLLAATFEPSPVNGSGNFDA